MMAKINPLEVSIAGFNRIEKLIKTEEEELEEQIVEQEETHTQKENQVILEDFTSKIKGAIFPAKIAISIFKQFQKKEVSKRTKFRGALELADGLDLEVCVYTKTAEEKMPTLKTHSLTVDKTTDAKEGEVNREVFYTDANDPEKKDTDAEEVIRAYFYGNK